MRRGQCLSPLTAPSLWSEDDVVPVQGTAFGGAEAAGVNSHECSNFFNISPELIFSFF